MLVLKVKAISLPYIFQVLYVLCFTRPRYQVSVYRTIGPLVYIFARYRHRLWVLNEAVLTYTYNQCFEQRIKNHNLSCENCHNLCNVCTTIGLLNTVNTNIGIFHLKIGTFYSSKIQKYII